ncbi:phosphatidylglycerol lysyltransferase domain-containing protein, partial [Pseudomonas aeruginosa]
QGQAAIRLVPVADDPRRGSSMIALYDPIGPAMQRAELIWQFRDLCDLHHARPVFYQVRAENLPFYMDIGLTA